MGVKSIVCTGCNEKNNPSFTQCWKCGASLSSLSGEQITAIFQKIKNTNADMSFLKTLVERTELEKEVTIKQYLLAAWKEWPADLEMVTANDDYSNIENIAKRLDELEELSKLALVNGDEFLKSHVTGLRKNYIFLYSGAIFSFGTVFMRNDLNQAGEIHGYLWQFLNQNLDILGIDKEAVSQLWEEILRFGKSSSIANNAEKINIEDLKLREKMHAVVDEKFKDLKDPEGIIEPQEIIKMMVNCFLTKFLVNLRKRGHI